MVDTTGLLIRVVVHAGNIRVADGAELIFEKTKEVGFRFKKVWAGMGYRGARLREWITQNTDWNMEIVEKPCHSRLVPDRS
jgi:transposase